MASFLKTLAFAAGAGVALGVCTTAGGRRAPRRVAVPAEPVHREPSVIDIEPLLDRLEKIERRLETAKAAPAPVVAVTELTRRIDAQDAEIERLRGMVDSSAVEIQSRLEAEMDRRERDVEFRISERIAALERVASDQSASIEALRVRAQDTDTNLQRLIVAIERLCERTQPVAPAPPPPSPVILPCEAHLKEAARAAEPEPEQKRNRSALTRIFGMLALLAIAGSQLV
jgi:uncharacterized coiled-coil protein SlyX